MPYLNTPAPTSELDAVNTLLAVVGEAPAAAIDNTRPDHALALQTLKETLLSELSKGWRFNTEKGLAIIPAGTVAWTDTAGTTTTLNVFKAPAALLHWEVTRTISQIGGSRPVVAAIRESKQYQEAGAPVEIFYDRLMNRDGWDDRDVLYIDATFSLDFENTPAVFRRLVVALASRKFAESPVVSGDVTQVQYTLDDIADARVMAMRLEGVEDDYNVLDNMDVYRALGGRPRLLGGRLSPWTNR